MVSNTACKNKVINSIESTGVYFESTASAVRLIELVPLDGKALNLYPCNRSEKDVKLRSDMVGEPYSSGRIPNIIKKEVLRAEFDKNWCNLAPAYARLVKQAMSALIPFETTCL